MSCISNSVEPHGMFYSDHCSESRHKCQVQFHLVAKLPRCVTIFERPKTQLCVDYFDSVSLFLSLAWSFLPCDVTPCLLGICRDICRSHVSVRPSCHKSVFYWSAKCRITQTTPHDSSGTLVSDAEDLSKTQMGVTPAEAPNAGGVS